MEGIKTIQGRMEAKGLKIAIVATRFNDFMVDHLIGGAVDYLTRHGAVKDDLTLIRIPGAFELPVVCKRLAASGAYDGIDFVAAEATKGIAHVALESGVPIGFGLLTTDNLEQAIERSGSKGGNKGVEAASALLETIRVLEQL